MQRPPSGPAAGSLVGQTLAGRYTIIDVVGLGGMATVYRATDRRLGRMVALKVLHPQFAADSVFVRRFAREAQIAARVSDHPHIVSIHDVDDDGALRYIVMEYVDGIDLGELLHREAPLSVAAVEPIAQQMASALDYAHARGLVHRDVKPRNVLIARDGRVKVADFGIARHTETTAITQTGTVVGTAGYMSPEAALGELAGPASDIYSFGVILYQMLTGRLPFEADNPVAMATQHLHALPPSLMTLNPAVPADVSAAVMQALDKRPEDRPSSAGELADALRDGRQPAQPTQEAPLLDTDEGAPTAVMPMRERLTPSRRSGFAASIALAVLLALGLLGWLVDELASPVGRHGLRPATTTTTPRSATPHSATPRPTVARIIVATATAPPVPTPVPTAVPAPAPVPAGKAKGPKKPKGPGPGDQKGEGHGPDHGHGQGDNGS